MDPFATGRAQSNDPGTVDEEIVRLHVSGHSAPMIAARLDIPVRIIRAAIDRATGDMSAGTRSNRIMVEDARLDALVRTYLPAAVDGDHDSAALVLAIGRDRRKLHGLDAPTAVTIDATLSVTSIEDVVTRILDDTLPVEAEDTPEGEDGDGFPVLDVSPARQLPTADPAPESEA